MTNLTKGNGTRWESMGVVNAQFQERNLVAIRNFAAGVAGHNPVVGFAYGRGNVKSVGVHSAWVVGDVVIKLILSIHRVT